MAKELTAKREAMARQFALTGNAAESYRRAGYKSRGDQDRQEGWKLLQNPDIQARVEHYRALIEKKLDVREERILAELAAIAFADPMDVLDFSRGGITVRDLREIPAHARAAIQSIEESPSPDGGMHLKVRFHAKVPALTKLAEIKGLGDASKKKGAPRVNINLNFNRGDSALPHGITIENEG